jgi:hypothetical protein
MAHMTQEDRDVLLGRIDAKVDILLKNEDKRDNRLSHLEHQLWWGRGALAVAIAAFVPKLRAILGF